MRTVLSVLCLLLAATIAAAASKRECKQACAAAIAACDSACFTFALAGKQCRKAVLRDCKRNGLEVCTAFNFAQAPPGCSITPRVVTALRTSPLTGGLATLELEIRECAVEMNAEFTTLSGVITVCDSDAGLRVIQGGRQAVARPDGVLLDASSFRASWQAGFSGCGTVSVGVTAQGHFDRFPPWFDVGAPFVFEWAGAQLSVTP